MVVESHWEERKDLVAHMSKGYRKRRIIRMKKKAKKRKGYTKEGKMRDEKSQR